jgi:hypothetical protein
LKQSPGFGGSNNLKISKMKISILITGSGIMSKGTLKRVCQTHNCEVHNLNFGNTEIRFKTKREAVKALSEAYQYLKSDKEDWDASCGSYLRGYSLSYDAGNARIVRS